MAITDSLFFNPDPNVQNTHHAHLLSRIESAQNKFTAFLDNAEKVTRYNQHVDIIIDHYSRQAQAAQPFIDDQPYYHLIRFYYLGHHLKINPQYTDRYRGFALSCSIDQDIEGSAMIDPEAEHLLVSPYFMDYSAALQKKIILHEMSHLVMYTNCMANDALFLMQQKNLYQYHAEELAADSLSDFIMPLPSIHDVFKTEDASAGTEPNDMIAATCLQPPPQTTHEIRSEKLFDHQYFMDEITETHPSANQRIENSARITEKLAEFRYNAYLERIYDNFVPDYKYRF